jgi:large subunit ribosomal protein L25
MQGAYQGEGIAFSPTLYILFLMITLEAQPRDKSQNNDALRKAGKMPAVFYGKKTVSTPIAVAQNEFIKAWRAAGESDVVSITGPMGTVEALIQDVAVDAVTDMPIHADFYVFEKGKKLEVSVPLEFIGVSPAVKDLAGILVKALREIKVSADPQHIPHEVFIDISSLVSLDSVITAGEVKLPVGVELIEQPEEVVASVTVAKDEPIEEAPVDLSSIEVEKKGKKEEEAEPAAE